MYQVLQVFSFFIHQVDGDQLRNGPIAAVVIFCLDMCWKCLYLSRSDTYSSAVRYGTHGYVSKTQVSSLKHIATKNKRIFFQTTTTSSVVCMKTKIFQSSFQITVHSETMDFLRTFSEFFSNLGERQRLFLHLEPQQVLVRP